MPALISRNEAQLFCGVTSSTTNDQLFDLLIQGVSKTIENFIGYPLLRDQEIIEYYSGRNQEAIVLRRRPVHSVSEVKLDSIGLYGQAPNTFGSDTVLTGGVDYFLDKTSPEFSSGLLKPKRWSTTVQTFSLPFRQGGLLTPIARKPTWPWGDGNIKVTYDAGFTNIPDDLRLATLWTVSYVFNNGPQGGGQITSESLGENSYTIGQLADGATTILSTVGPLAGARQILSRYREIAVGASQ